MKYSKLLTCSLVNMLFPPYSIQKKVLRVKVEVSACACSKVRGGVVEGRKRTCGVDVNGRCNKVVAN